MSGDNEGLVNTRHRCAAIIAVARFDPFSDNSHENRLELGFLEDVIAELSRVPDFEVLAPRTSLSLSREELDPRRLAETFGVTHLLDTGLRAMDERLLVKANLIEVATGRAIWSHRYEASRRDAGDVLADIAAHVANAMSVRVRLTRLADARSRPLTSLAAHDCWVRGHDHLRRSTPEDDEAARGLFERALAIDPGYARAYAGLALSHFKRWNWRAATPQEEEGDRLSAHYAARAAALDDMDPVVQVVLGRTEVYRRNFGPGQRALERALSLSPNHADCLMQMAPLWAYLGEVEAALDLVRKAFRLNPLHDPWYYFTAFIPHFLAGELEVGVAILERSPPNMIFEQSALLAASYAHLGRVEEARALLPAFHEEFETAILGGRRAQPGEALRHILDSNPFQRSEHEAFLIEGLRRAGLGEPGPKSQPQRLSEEGRFQRLGELWEVAYSHVEVRVPDMKGCRDIALLLASPGERIHCMDLAGRLVEGDSGVAMDAKARAACQRRLLDLQEDLSEAERHSDLARCERLNAELDQLVEQLSAAMGLGGRGRRLGDPAEKARTAVTWRIRSAIKRIGQAHPELGRHLQASIRTGAFCAYSPERPIRWRVAG